MDLETKLSEVQKEVVEGGATRKSRLSTDWIPRPPERFELTGHRAPVTRVIFHPTYRYILKLNNCMSVCVYNNIVFPHTNSLVLSCSEDATIKVCDTTDCVEWV